MFTKPSCPTLCIVLAAILLQGCGKTGTNTSANLSSNGSSTQATSKGSPLSGFERDLQFVRNGQYAYVWVFSRKDGKPLDKDDGAYLRTNAPQVVDWVTTDGGKRAIGGTNFDLEQGNMNLLRKRFVVEDYTGKSAR
jgi:hypothetical protein